jgi:proteasome lid subunit RPN8/RPN11
MHLPRTVVNELLKQAQGSPEAEVCGLIGSGDDGRASVYPVSNVAEAPDRLFQMEPSAQIGAMRRMRERGETLLAIYHSHPHAPAAPSPRDLEEAAYPEALYLVISLDTKGVLEMRGYRLDGNTPREVELKVLE